MFYDKICFPCPLPPPTLMLVYYIKDDKSRISSDFYSTLIDWLIDLLIDCLRFTSCSRMFHLWRRHHCRYRVAKCRLELGARSLLAGSHVYCSWGFGFFQVTSEGLSHLSHLTTRIGMLKTKLHLSFKKKMTNDGFRIQSPRGERIWEQVFQCPSQLAKIPPINTGS
jgi:hypothetical protein